MNRRELAQPSSERVSQGGFTDGAAQDADRRDADLHSGQKIGGVVVQRQSRMGTRAAVLGEAL